MEPLDDIRFGTAPLPPLAPLATNLKKKKKKKINGRKYGKTTTNYFRGVFSTSVSGINNIIFL